MTGGNAEHPLHLPLRLRVVVVVVLIMCSYASNLTVGKRLIILTQDWLHTQQCCATQCKTLYTAILCYINIHSMLTMEQLANSFS